MSKEILVLEEQAKQENVLLKRLQKLKQPVRLGSRMETRNLIGQINPPGQMHRKMLQKCTSHFNLIWQRQRG
jgi:hypothetical protein